MASKKKDKKPKDKRSKKELRAALKTASGLLGDYTVLLEDKDEIIAAFVASQGSFLKAKDERIEELEAKLIPARAIAEAIQRDCPPGTRCNALVNVIYYPCGTSKVVATQRDWWLSLLKE